MTFRKWAPSFLAVLALGLATTLVTVDVADARRGGSFGSRGGRTFQAPPSTPTAPRAGQPVDRTTTSRTQQNGQSMAARPGFFGGGFAGSMMRGLLIGGLLGVLLGHGLGGLAGLFGLIVQIGLVALVIMLAMRFFRSRQAATATASGPAYGGGMPGQHAYGGQGNSTGSVPGAGGGLGRGGNMFQSRRDAITVGQPDLNTFERLLGEVQIAFGREDHGALQQRTTSEVMSYLAEELAGNASRGLRNEVSDVKLLQGDVAEAWREGALDYATVAMRYESRDVTRERATGRVVEGDPDRLTQTTEIWTFVRSRGADWKLSAIQEA